MLHPFWKGDKSVLPDAFLAGKLKYICSFLLPCQVSQAASAVLPLARAWLTFSTKALDQLCCVNYVHCVHCNQGYMKVLQTLHSY